MYEAFTARIDPAWLSGPQWLQMARQRARWATVLGTGSHFAGEGWMEFQRHRDPWRRCSLRVFSLQRPLSELVAALNAFDPAVLTSYPSALELLADEQLAGRLQVRPVIVELGGESLDDDARARIAAGLGGALHDAYSASECMAMAYDCAHGWLHVNSDWVILEAVDADGRPTAPGEASHTVLLTNLANRVQPIIRYDLGDTVLARPDPCPCGNPCAQRDEREVPSGHRRRAIAPAAPTREHDARRGEAREREVDGRPRREASSRPTARARWGRDHPASAPQGATRWPPLS